MCLELDSVGTGSSSVRAGRSTGGGVAEEEDSEALQLPTTSSTGGGARADEGIYQNIVRKYCFWRHIISYISLRTKLK